MRKFLKAVCIVCLLAVLFSGTIACTQSQNSPANYPVKTIKMIVPWPAGGSTDIIARAVATTAEKHFKVPVIVENRPGGGGVIGTQEAATAKGDGYTILVAAIAPTILQPYYNDLNYSPEDFKAIAQVSVREVVIAVKSDSPWQTLSDFIEAAKNEPNKYSFAVTQGVQPHLLFEMLAKEAGFQAKLFPVQGDPQSITAVLGKNADVSVVSSIGSIKPQLDANEMRALAVFSEERSKVLPDVPTVKELGFDIVGYPWTGLMVPKETPDEIVKVVEEKFRAVIQDPELEQQLVNAGESSYYLNGKDFMDKVLKEYKEFGVIINELGLGKNSN